MLDLTIEETVAMAEYGLQAATGIIAPEQVQAMRKVAQEGIKRGVAPFVMWSEIVTPIIRYWRMDFREGRDITGFSAIYETLGLDSIYCPTDVAATIARFAVYTDMFFGDGLISTIYELLEKLDVASHRELRINIVYKSISILTATGLHTENPELTRQLLDIFAEYSLEDKKAVLQYIPGFLMR